jgi:hypothetical protein
MQQAFPLFVGAAMATPVFERNQPVLVKDAASPSARPDVQATRPRETWFGFTAILIASVIAALWVGGAAAWLWGYFGPGGLLALDVQQIALFGVATFLPPALFLAVAWTLARGHAMGRATEALIDATDRLFSADETASRTAARLGRAVRRELDAFNTGLDSAFSRMRALESALENQIAALDEVSARAEVRGESVAARLAKERERVDAATGSLSEAAARAGETVASRLFQERERLDAMAGSLSEAAARAGEIVASRLVQERERLDAVTGSLSDAAARAGETVSSRLAVERERLDAVADVLVDSAARAGEIVAGRAAQLKASFETAETSLRAAGQALESQAADFRAAASAAAEAPRLAAVELDRQAKSIESVSEATMARAEFVLGRHERHRASMNDLLLRLKDESASFESTVAQECAAMGRALDALGGEAQKFETITGNAEHHLEQLVHRTSTQTNQLTQSIMHEAERLNEASEAANATLARLAEALHEASTAARTLIGETANQAKNDAHALVGEAMAECERLLRTSGELSARAQETRAALASVAEEAQRHVLALPGVAQQEAQRIRQMVRNETEEMLDISARTLSTIRARTAAKPPSEAPPAEQTDEERERESLFGLARKLTGRQKQKPRAGSDEPKAWEMSKLLAAVETSESRSKEFKPSTAAALGALETALADLAVDLGGIAGDEGPGNEDWRSYLAGDRAVFARRLASTIDAGTVDRITELYREDIRFRDAADLYISEFETLLARAREGDGGGLLTPTILSADTGKIYLAVAYALGRL